MAEKFSVTAEAGVNLTDGPHVDQSTAPGAVVSASAAGAGNTAKATAGASAMTGACRSENSEITKPALAKASLGVRYALEGSTGGGSVPLNFNFAFSGSVTAEPGPPPVGGTGSAHGSYSLETLDAKKRAGARIAVGPKGPPLITTSGSFEKKGSLKIRLTPIVTIEVGSFELFAADLEELEVDLDLEFDTTDFDASAFAAIIAEAIEAAGLPRLGIAPGTTVGVSFGVTMTISMVDSLEVSVEQGGFLSANLEAGSAAGTLAKGEADFGASLVLQSVTLAEGARSDLADKLLVRFESGLSMKVTRYGQDLEASSRDR